MYSRLLRYHTFITALFAFAIIGGWDIVYHEYIKGDLCPKFLNIPICYIIFGLYCIAFIAHLFPVKKVWKLYFGPIGLVFLIALVGTSVHFIGKWFQIAGCPECPPTYLSLPACLASLFIAFFLFRYKIKLVWYTE